jgi:tetratricopeptide (TPR) repeat protein
MTRLLFTTPRLISCAVLGAKYGRKKDYFDLELLQLYKIFLDKDLYKDNKTNYVPASLYRLIISHGVKVNRPEWLHNIISEAGPKLHPNLRENLQNYALANYYSVAGEYNTAFEYINKLEIDYFMFKYDLYYLKLKAYYDLGELEPALELLHTFRQFIRNDSIITSSRKVFTIILRYSLKN